MMPAAYFPIRGFTTADLGYERGPATSNSYLVRAAVLSVLTLQALDLFLRGGRHAKADDVCFPIFLQSASTWVPEWQETHSAINLNAPCVECLRSPRLALAHFSSAPPSTGRVMPVT